MTDREYLEEALEFIVKREEDNDYICEELLDDSKENVRCSDDCQGFDKFCVYRLLEIRRKKKALGI